MGDEEKEWDAGPLDDIKCDDDRKQEEYPPDNNMIPQEDLPDLIVEIKSEPDYRILKRREPMIGKVKKQKELQGLLFADPSVIVTLTKNVEHRNLLSRINDGYVVHEHRFPQPNDIVVGRKDGRKLFLVTSIDRSDATVLCREILIAQDMKAEENWIGVNKLNIIADGAEWNLVMSIFKRANFNVNGQHSYHVGDLVELTEAFTYKKQVFFTEIKVVIPMGTQGIVTGAMASAAEVAFFEHGMHVIHQLKMIKPSQPDTGSWDSVVLPDDIKEMVLAVAQYDLDKANATPLGCMGIRGRFPHILLYGPPGCGKSHLVHALGKKLAKPVNAVHGADCEDIEKLGRVFQLSERVRAVTFIDEVDHLNDECRQSLYQALEEMNTPVIMATNMIVLPDALVSRIPVMIKIDKPTENARADIWRVHLGKNAKSVNVVDLAKHELSGRDIKYAIQLCAARRLMGIAKPTEEQFDEALSTGYLKNTIETMLRSRSEHEAHLKQTQI